MTYPHDEDLLLASYHYDLPPELIAQRPVHHENRHDSRLLVYNQKTGVIIHDTFINITKYLPPESLIVFNQSKVFPSRLPGKKASGGKAELFFLSHLGNELGNYPCLIRTTSKKKRWSESIEKL